MLRKLISPDKNKRSVLFIALTIVALFLHGKVPYMLPLSVGLFFILIIDVFYTKRQTISSLVVTFFEYIKKTWLYLGIVLIFFLSVLFHQHKEIILIKELLYALYVWSIIGFLFVLLKQFSYSEKQFNLYFQKGYIVLFLVVLLGVFINIFKGNILFNNLFGIRIDYNYLAFSLITCFIIIIYYYHDLRLKKYSWFWLVYLIILLIPGLLTGSRRGIFLWGVMHVILLGYLFWSYYRKSLHKLLLYYFLFLFILFFSSSILFYTGSAAFKSYLIERLFPTNHQKVKSQYSQKLYRYSSITNNDSLTFKDQYNKDWNPKPFQSNSWLNNIMFNKIHQRFVKAYEQNKYDQAFSHLVELRNFSSSLEQFCEILPNNYKPFLTNEFVMSDSFPDAPYLYPIPFVDHNFYAINNFKNIYPANRLAENYQLPLSFVKTDDSEASMSLFIPLVPNSRNIVTFKFKGIKANQLEFILKRKDQLLPFQKEKITESKENYISASLEFNVLPEYKGLGQIILKLNMNLEDTLFIGQHSHLRSPLNEKISSTNTNELARTIKRLKNGRIKNHNNYYQRYISQFKTLSHEKLDSFNYLLDNFHFYRANFRPYGQHSVLITESDSLVTFQSSGFSSFARCFAIIPTIKDIDYSIQLTVKSEKKPYIYLKRFPEKTIFELKKRVNKKEITLTKPTIYKINYDYSVNESTSAIGALVVGIRKANENDFFEISNFCLSIQKNNAPLEITPYQYSFIEPYLNNISKDNDKRMKDLQYNKYLFWRDQNGVHENQLLNSRLLLWRFAWFYFNDFSLQEKLFGRGFEYLKVYHYVFDNEGVNSDGIDYPHNPIISAVLYSGIVGAVFYVLFLLQVFYRYWKLRKRITLFAILYLLAFAFTFFSGNSHFSVPAFLILSLIPYAYDIKIYFNASE
ncbi:MAG: O-antigen ligase family protein [Bacteroidales bacterium]